ncbi:unnamed protein product [Protopolystoma xenopodis]|uniref:Uncharacterized protein n=1 Tax=Protopolystoma xenopodis TaxID=117903 RepID=A0A3S5FFS6_9PLAT|nr:unnamed protein product [Protopolystoma xenopodis]
MILFPRNLQPDSLSPVLLQASLCVYSFNPNNARPYARNQSEPRRPDKASLNRPGHSALISMSRYGNRKSVTRPVLSFSVSLVAWLALLQVLLATAVLFPVGEAAAHDGLDENETTPVSLEKRNFLVDSRLGKRTSYLLAPRYHQNKRNFLVDSRLGKRNFLIDSRLGKRDEREEYENEEDFYAGGLLPESRRPRKRNFLLDSRLGK